MKQCFLLLLSTVSIFFASCVTYSPHHLASNTQFTLTSADYETVTLERVEGIVTTTYVFGIGGDQEIGYGKAYEAALSRFDKANTLLDVTVDIVIERYLFINKRTIRVTGIPAILK